MTHNLEHVFGLCVPELIPINISPREHTQFGWYQIDEAIEKVFSWTNADALKFLMKHRKKLIGIEA